MNTLIKKLFFTLSACLLLAVSLQIAGAAPPVLNWTRQGTAGGNAFMDCNRTGSVAGGNCETNGNAGFGQGATDPDKAPFLQETVVFDGITYFHVIVGTRGEPTVGDGNTFAQEVYIQVQSGTNCDPTFATAPCSLSGGRRGDNGNYQVNSGVGWDPLSSDSTFSGNGSGNPKAVIMKQVLNDPANGLTQVFLKDTLNLKPKITQNIVDGGVSAQFVLDMGNSDYTVNTTPGLMTNKLTLLGTDAPQGNFDATAPTQTFNIANAPTPHITGGLYTYTAGTGWSGSGATATYDKGSYTYAESGSVNLTTLDWNSFRDPADNLMDFGGTLAERKRGGNICKGGTATTPPAGC